jgi:AcrR family transcriptional regulator
MTRRPYDNTRRTEQARLTRRRILAAARDLLVERGPAAVTMRDVATEAGVSPETVYKTFGTKAALIKDVYDVTLAGDDEPIAMIDRPEIRAVFAATTPQGKVTAYARAARGVSERTDLARFHETINRERMGGATAIVGQLVSIGGLRDDVSPERARDIVWTLISPEVYELLVGERGWSLDDYEQWLAQAFADALVTRG